MKNVTSIILAIILLFSTQISIYAKDDLTNSQSKIDEFQNYTLTTEMVITDQDELDEYAKKFNYAPPEGHNLEKIEIYAYIDNSSKSLDLLVSDTVVANPVQPLGLFYTIKNVRVSPKEFYYVNDYDSDYFYGPCDVSESYTKTSSTKISVSTNIGNSNLKAAIGYDRNDTFSYTKTFSTSVAAGKVLNVRVHTNYKSTEFDIYNTVTGELVEKNAWTAKPIGLIFMQFTSSV